jgi:WD40 repeat protein
LADRDHVVREIHAETGEPIRAFGRHTGEVLDVVVSRDGRRLATAGVDGTVRVWSVNGSRKPLTFRRHADRVEAISFSADGRTIASISRDGTAYLWRTVDGAVQRVLGGSHRTPTYQAQSLQRRDTPSAPLPPVVSGSTFMGAVRSPSSAAHAASLATVDRASNRSEPPVACGSSFSVAFSPDGSIIATAGWNRSVQLWDARDGNLLGQLTAERGCITCLGFSPEGDQLATGGLEGDLILWDVSRRRVSCTVKAHAGPVGSIAFSPSGAWIASAATDGMSKLWSVPRTIAQ